MTNLEAKFRLRDLKRARTAAESIGYRYRETWRQRDTFFRVARGKLKIREEPRGAMLIYYAREERNTLQVSSYEIVSVAEPAKLRAILASALGVLGEVRKERTLLMRDWVRLHLDQVEGLGEFGEIEAVIAAGDEPELSRAAVEELLAALGVERGALIAQSYFELISSA
ncbi:MAG TPA: class IV adenylate cyclase [Candidatus Binataceae bacterium]|nr:class IV adenylate cyclase [Candidatus Binataceae bacterium]